MEESRTIKGHELQSFSSFEPQLAAKSFQHLFSPFAESSLSDFFPATVRGPSKRQEVDVNAKFGVRRFRGLRRVEAMARVEDMRMEAES